MKFVTVILTTHNRIELLKKALYSVQNQTYPNIEIVVVDDNSTDGSKEFLDKVPGIKHIFIPEEESKGGNYARNLGIKEANGDYLAFLDDDDEWLPEKIFKQMELVERYPEVGLVYCSFIEEINFNERRNVIVEDEVAKDFSQICFSNIFCTTSMMLVKKELILDIGTFDEELKFWQEYDLCIRLCQKTKVVAVKSPVMILRVIEGDKNRLSNKYNGWVDAVNYIENKYKELIQNLPPEIKKERELMILREKAFRLDKVGRNKEKRDTLFKIWKLTKKPKHFIKFVLNTAKFYGK
jgi:glycosyltransferase involved in cell wall biosynthesis